MMYSQEKILILQFPLEVTAFQFDKLFINVIILSVKLWMYFGDFGKNESL